MIRFQCPKCKERYEVSEKMVGKKARCSKCWQALVVTPQPSQPARAPVSGVTSTPRTAAKPSRGTIHVACSGCMATYDMPQEKGRRTSCPACGQALVAVRNKPTVRRSSVPTGTALRVAGVVGAAALGIGLLWVGLASRSGTQGPQTAPAAVTKKAAQDESTEKLLASAEEAIANKNTTQAKLFLQKYLTTPKVAEIDRATSLLNEVEKATSDEKAAVFIATLNDAEVAYLADATASLGNPARVRGEIEMIDNSHLKAAYEQTLRRNARNEHARREDVHRQEAKQEKAAREKLEQEDRENEMKLVRQLRKLEEQRAAERVTLQKQLRKERSKQAYTNLLRYQIDLRANNNVRESNRANLAAGMLREIHDAYVARQLNKETVGSIRRRYPPDVLREALYIVDIAGDIIPNGEQEATLGESMRAFLTIWQDTLSNP